MTEATMNDLMFLRLLAAVRVHKELIETGQLSESLANRVLWMAADHMEKEAGKCTGDCCG
jgi:hypothetical protein